MPSINGLVIRFGEGGRSLQHRRLAVSQRDGGSHATSLRAMLRWPAADLREPAEDARASELDGRRRATRPSAHRSDGLREVLGDIDSPALVVSTKFTAGDFFSYLPLNPTLIDGRHRRLVELQAQARVRRLSARSRTSSARSTRAPCARFARANPHLAGTYIFTQFGGPLRAGPRMLYPLHGFWLWTDANVFVASHLASDPGADVTRPRAAMGRAHLW